MNLRRALDTLSANPMWTASAPKLSAKPSTSRISVGKPYSLITVKCNPTLKASLKRDMTSESCSGKSSLGVVYTTTPLSKVATYFLFEYSKLARYGVKTLINQELLHFFDYPSYSIIVL